MAIVNIELPEITRISYRQEKEDKDYGSCLWARFNFDTKNYSLAIESDCGSYHYGWCPTPKFETFLQLCSRFDYEYLLYKISDMTTIDSENTWKNIKEVVQEYIEDLFEDDCSEDFDDYFWDQLEAACYHNADERDTYDSICNVLDETDLYGKYESEDIFGAIEKDYPTNAKKIVQVFRDHIQPAVRELSGYKRNGGEDNV
jgi:hypothetical protein